MVKNSKKLSKVNKAKNIVYNELSRIPLNKKELVIQKVKNSPTIDFRFLYHSNKCLKFAFDEFGKSSNEYKNFIDNFQKFIYDFSIQESYDMAIKCFSSRNNGQKTKGDAQNRLLNCLPEEIKDIARDELTHLHLKPNGNGIALVHGFAINDRFYIIALDPKHELLSN